MSWLLRVFLRLGYFDSSMYQGTSLPSSNSTFCLLLIDVERYNLKLFSTPNWCPLFKKITNNVCKHCRNCYCVIIHDIKSYSCVCATSYSCMCATSFSCMCATSYSCMYSCMCATSYSYITQLISWSRCFELLGSKVIISDSVFYFRSTQKCHVHFVQWLSYKMMRVRGIDIFSFFHILLGGGNGVTVLITLTFLSVVGAVSYFLYYQSFGEIVEADRWYFFTFRDYSILLISLNVCAAL